MLMLMLMFVLVVEGGVGVSVGWLSFLLFIGEECG